MIVPKKSRFEKKCEVLQKHLEIYKTFIKILLGFELDEEEDLNYNCILMNFKKKLNENIEIFPDCIIRFYINHYFNQFNKPRL